jgi:hypothetical protein
VRESLKEIARVLVPGGRSLIQLPNAFGIRALYHQAKRGFSEPQDFDVRYWTVGELRRTFESLVGPTAIRVDGYFSLNPQTSDVAQLPARYRAIVRASDVLRRLSERVTPISYVADSLYVDARRIEPGDVGQPGPSRS